MLPNAALKWHMRVLRLPYHAPFDAQVALLPRTSAWLSLHTLDFSLFPFRTRAVNLQWMHTMLRAPGLRVLRMRSVENCLIHHELLQMVGRADRGTLGGLSLEVWCDTTLPVQLACELPLKKLRLESIIDVDLYTLCQRSHTLVNVRTTRVRVTHVSVDDILVGLQHDEVRSTSLEALTIVDRLRSSTLLRVLSTYTSLRHLDVVCARKTAHQRGLMQLKQLESLRLVVPDVVSFIVPLLAEAADSGTRPFPKLRRLTLRNQDVDHQEDAPDDDGTSRSQLDQSYDENGSRLPLSLLFGLTALTHLDVSDILFTTPDTTSEKDAGRPRSLRSLTYLAITYDTESTKESAIFDVADVEVDVADMFPNLEELRINVEALDFHDPFGIGWCRKLRILNLQLDGEFTPSKYKHLLRRDCIACPNLRLVRVTQPLPSDLERWTRAQGIDVSASTYK
jgi:hypothetical protein